MLVKRKHHSLILEFYSCPFLVGNVLCSTQVFLTLLITFTKLLQKDYVMHRVAETS